MPTVHTKIVQLVGLGRHKSYLWGDMNQSLVIVKTWADEEVSVPDVGLRAANLHSFSDRTRERGMEWWAPIELIEKGVPTRIFRLIRTAAGLIDNKNSRLDMIWPVEKVVWHEGTPYGLFSQSKGIAV